VLGLLALLVVGVLGAIFLSSRNKPQPATQVASTPSATHPLPQTTASVSAATNATVQTTATAQPTGMAASVKPPPLTTPLPAATNVSTNAPGDLPTMEINKAVMVTVELDFGAQMPSIADALMEVERQHQPEDGVGRVFAILDAYGGPTDDGKKLHISMHVSTEKPGVGALIFKRTGEVLWKSRVVLGTNAPSQFSGKDLYVLVDDGKGRTLMVDGSNNPATVLDAKLRDRPGLVRDIWPDGYEREMTFIYSACGCPVKVMCKRTGDLTVRTKDTPVMFPDDPSVMVVIGKLMGWR
jgi:hypothetical protein